jgi:hypothetical protein
MYIHIRLKIKRHLPSTTFPWNLIGQRYCSINQILDVRVDYTFLKSTFRYTVGSVLELAIDHFLSRRLRSLVRVCKKRANSSTEPMIRHASGTTLRTLES